MKRRHLLGLAAAAPWVAQGQAPGRSEGDGNTIVFGQSAPISGRGQHFGIEYTRGLKLRLDAANASGGVNGRRIDLVTYDDQYEAETAAFNTADLITSDKAFALIGYVGAEMALRSLAVPQAAGVPFIAPLSGAEVFRGPTQRNVINFRPSHAAEVGALVRQMSIMSVRKVATLVQSDSDGRGLLESLRTALASEHIHLVAEAETERNSTINVTLNFRDIKAAVAKLLAKQPDVIVFLTAHATAAQAIREARAGGFKGSFYATSLGSAAGIAKLLAEMVRGVVVSQVVPWPFGTTRAVVNDYRAALGTTAPDHTSLEGWLVGAMTVEALRRCGANLTRARFMDAMLGLGTLDLGGFGLNMQPARRQASSFVELTIMDDKGRVLR